jgi:pSer/pThr/pTyr-binding forkhead associated (FHA) protein
VVELNILSGKQAGASIVARRFPFLVGRSADSGLRLDDEGVFDRHFAIRLEAQDGFVLAVQPQAYVGVNGQTAQQTRLKSGDLISVGSVKMGFALSVAPQRDLRFREALMWAGLVFLCIAQVALVYLLMD